MLTIDKPKHGGSAGGYYFRYYTRDAQAPGFWFGRGADLLGLPAEVTREHFNNLVEGFSPDGTQPLVQNAGHERRRGFWDLTFSAPKSLSTLYAVASPERRQEIKGVTETALRSTLMEVEEALGMSRQGKAGKEIVPGALAFAVFFHETSRANDPQLHFHCVLANVAVRPDGTTGGVFSKPLFEEKKRIGLLFREKLAAELRQQLGLEITMTKHAFDIEGVPQELNDTFSKRSKELRKFMAKHGLAGAVDAKKAAIKTRAPKKYTKREVLSAAWGEVSKAHGFGPEKVQALWQRGQLKLKEAARTQPREEKREEKKRANTEERSKAFGEKEEFSRGGLDSEEQSTEREQKRSQAKKPSQSKERSQRSEKERLKALRRFEKELREARDKIFVENQTRARLTKVGFALAYKHDVDRNLVAGAVDRLKLPIQRRFYRIEWAPLFPKSPLPFLKNLRVRKYVLANRKRRWGKITWRIKIPKLGQSQVSLSSQRRTLFPASPIKRLAAFSLPAIRVRKEERDQKLTDQRKQKPRH